MYLLLTGNFVCLKGEDYMRRIEDVKYFNLLVQIKLFLLTTFAFKILLLPLQNKHLNLRARSNIF